jgi:ketopantoate reductase
MADSKKTVLIVGGGAVGAIAAVNLEAGGLATVTVVLRSNYNVVKDKGYTIHSCDHGTLNGWRPSIGMLQPTSATAVLASRLTITSSQHCPQPH